MKSFTNTSSVKTINASRLASKSARMHSWVTVIDPRNDRLLLQACDDCGVVKSENSVVRKCRSVSGRGLLTGEMSIATQIAI